MGTAVLAVHNDVSTTIPPHFQEDQLTPMPEYVTLKLDGDDRTFNVFYVIGLFQMDRMSRSDSSKNMSIEKHLYSCRTIESRGLAITEAVCSDYRNKWSKELQTLFGVSADAIGTLADLYHSKGGPARVREQLTMAWLKKMGAH